MLEVATFVVVVPETSVVGVVGTVVVVVDRVVEVELSIVVVDTGTPEVVVVLFGLVVVVAGASVPVGALVVGETIVVGETVVVGWARGTGGPIPLVRVGGFVVGTGTVGTGVVGAGVRVVVVGIMVGGAVVVGAGVVGAVVVGAVVVVGGGIVFGGVVFLAPVVGAVELGGVYFGAVVMGRTVVGAAVVRSVTAGCERAVVEVVEPVAAIGTSACAVRLIEPKALLSWAFSASSLASRCSSAAKSWFSAAIAAVSLAVEGCAASGADDLPRMAFDACSMYCLALSGLCLAR